MIFDPEKAGLTNSYGSWYIANDTTSFEKVDTDSTSGFRWRLGSVDCWWFGFYFPGDIDHDVMVSILEANGYEHD